MSKITKDMCVSHTFTKKEFAFCIIIEIITTCLIWWRTYSIFWLFFGFIFFVVLDVFVLYERRKSHLEDKVFYIVEDTFLNAQEVKVFINQIHAIKHWRRYNYKISFARNGTHEVIFYSKKEPKELDFDYSAVFFSKPGDEFYLLISKGKEEEFIIKAFNKKYYKLIEEDFDYIDGKYYPKKV